ncbi:MAG: hypothetical protein N2376_06625 [Clostridia bacterium]|nr:hypothetical protein [Clostridia bacterium]
MINIISALFLLLSSLYTFSFAKSSWKENQKLGAIGALLIVFLGWGISLIVLMRT